MRGFSKKGLRMNLDEVKSIAVLGLSPNETKASFIVSKYLQEKGFKIIPIYPKEDFILNERVYKNLDEVKENIDLVLMFRKGEFASELFETILKKGIKRFWLQLGIKNDDVKEKCAKNKISFVQDKCIMKELEAKK